MIFLIYIPVVFICLFILYVISRHDFVLLRQNINLRKIFDNAFIIILSSFFTSRIGFILYSQKYDLLNPLKFIYLPKYWGILTYFGFLSMGICIYLLFRKKKNLLRIMDIYAISFSPMILLDIAMQENHGINIYLKIISAIILSLFYFWFVKINNKFSLKDGFMTSIIFITYSLVSLAFNFSNVGFLNMKYVWFQSVLFLSILFFSVILFFIQKENLSKWKS